MKERVAPKGTNVEKEMQGSSLQESEYYGEYICAKNDRPNRSVREGK